LLKLNSKLSQVKNEFLDNSKISDDEIKPLLNFLLKEFLESIINDKLIISKKLAKCSYNNLQRYIADLNHTSFDKQVALESIFYIESWLNSKVAKKLDEVLIFLLHKLKTINSNFSISLSECADYSPVINQFSPLFNPVENASLPSKIKLT